MIEAQRRLKRVRLFPPFLTNMLTTGYSVGTPFMGVKCAIGLPPGALLVDIQKEHWALPLAGFPDGYFMAVFEHPSFDVVPEGEEIPELEVLYAYTKKEGALLPVEKQGDATFFGRPRLSGHYWHRHPDENSNKWHAVFYEAEEGRYYHIGTAMGYDLARTKGHEWQGPIPMPCANSLSLVGQSSVH